MLNVPTSLVLLYCSDLLQRHQPVQGLVLSVVVICFTVLTAFQVFGTCCDCTVWFIYSDDRMCRTGQGALVLLAPNLRECIDQVQLVLVLGAVITRSCPFPCRGWKIYQGGLDRSWLAGYKAAIPLENDQVFHLLMVISLFRIRFDLMARTP